jgi:WD40 repeat protein
MFRFHVLMAFLLFADPASAQEPGKSANAPRTDSHGDPLPAGALRRLGTVRFRQPCIHDMAFTPDGKTLVVEGPGLLVQWDVATGKELRTIPTAPGNLRSLGLSRDGRLVAIPSDGENVVVLEFATGKELFRKKLVGYPEGGGVISPDNSRIAISAVEESGVWDLKTGEHLAKLPGTADLKFSPDGKWVAGRSWVRRAGDPIILFDAKSGQERGSFAHPNYLKNRDNIVMKTYGFRPDARSLMVSWWVSGTGEDLGIMIYDLKTQKLSRRIDIDAHFVASSPDSKVIVASKERVVILLNADTGKEIRRWELSDTALPLSYGAFSPDGKTLALGFEGGVQLWNSETGKRVDPFDGPITTPGSLAVSNDGQTFAALYGWSPGQSVRLFDTLTLREKGRIDSGPDCLSNLAFSPDGRRLAFVEANYGVPNKKLPQTRMLDVVSGKEIKALKKIDGDFTHWKGSDAVVVMQGTWEEGHWVTVDVATGQERDRMPIPTDRADDHWSMWSFNEPRHMVLDNRKLLEPPNDDRRMFLAEWPSGKRIRPLVFADGGKRDMTRGVYHVSPDGRLIVTGESRETEVGPTTLSETATGRVRFQVKQEFRDEMMDVSCSPDGRVIVIARWDKHILVDSLTFEPLMEWAPKAGSGASFAFSANGQIMVTGDTSAITVWDLKTALRPRTISPDKLSAADLAKLWIELEGTDAQVGHRAMITLYRRPDDAIAYLKTKLPASLPDKATFQRLVRELDDANFKKREAAHNAIVKMGDGAGVLIRDAMKESPSLETNRRLAVLADKLKVTDAVRIRWLRCVELLERIGTPPARAVLEQFRNVADAETSADATRSLDRLAVSAR